MRIEIHHTLERDIIGTEIMMMKMMTDATHKREIDIKTDIDSIKMMIDIMQEKNRQAYRQREIVIEIGEELEEEMAMSEMHMCNVDFGV